MSVDLQSRGAAFKRQLLGDIQEMIVSLLSTVSATVAAQQEGIGISDGHRTFNFTGAGVSVTDDPSSRRAVINIPGGVSTSPRTSVLVSAAGAGFVLVSATTPANDGSGNTWRQVGYAHSGWSATIANTYNYANDNAGSVIPGATFVCPIDGTVPSTQVFYLHHEFTLTASQVNNGILDFNLDQLGEVYINDTLVGTDSNPTAHAYLSANIPGGLLVAGTNVIAIRVQNSTGGLPNPSSVAYRITVHETGAGILSQNLGADSASFSTTTATIMSMTLTTGTWLVFAHTSIRSTGAAASVAMELTDGTTHYGSAGATTAGANFQASLTVISELIIVSGSLTLNMSCQAQSASVAQASTSQGSFTKATHMRALRIA